MLKIVSPKNCPFLVLHRINFVGNKKVSDRELRQIQLLNEGDYWNYSMLIKSIKRLNDSGKLERVRLKDVKIVVVDWRRQSQTEQMLDIAYYVRDKKRKHRG